MVLLLAFSKNNVLFLCTCLWQAFMIITRNHRTLLLLAGFCCVFFTTTAQSFFHDDNTRAVTAETIFSLKESSPQSLEFFLSTENVSPRDSTCLPAVSIIVSENNICGGTSVTFHATVTNGGTVPKFNWKKNGVSPRLIDNPNYTSSDFHDGDVVVCEYSCKTACGVDTTVVSNAITMHVSHDVAPTITVYNEDTLICQGELTVFKTESFYGDWTPTFQWFVNDTAVGTNSPVFATSTLVNGAKVECVLTVSSPACPGIIQTTRSQMRIYVYPLVHPIISIKPSKTDICRGEEITFTATANGGAYPAFTWMVNGVKTGPNAPSLSISTLKDGDKITCTVTIEQDSRCHESTTSSNSNEIVVHVRDYPEPEVTISSPLLDVCKGETITFTAVPKNPGGLVLYQWQVNGTGVGPNSPVFSYNGFNDGDKVFCLLTTNIQGCPFSRTAISDTESVTIRNIPVITFTPPEISIMSGESAQLKASVSDSISSFLWQPVGVLVDPQTLTPTTVPLMQDTVLQLSVVDENGCEAANEILIKVLHKLYMPSAFTPNGDGKNDVFRIPPGASLDLKEFLVFNRWGNVVFKTSDMSQGWNGTYNGALSEAGIYVYLIKGSVLGQKVTIKGTVMLIR